MVGGDVATGVRVGVSVPVGVDVRIVSSIRTGVGAAGVGTRAAGRVVEVDVGLPQAIARTIKTVNTPEILQALFIFLSSLVEIAELWTLINH